MKKLIVLILAVMLLLACAIPAQAADSRKVEAAAVLYDLGLFQGTGTNADSILITRGGVKTGVLSIPQGYMHTPVEKILPEDIENTARLLAAYVKKEGNRK